MIRMRPRFGRAKKKDPVELIKFRLKMVQLFSDAIALLKEEGNHELAEELRKTKKYTERILRKAVARARGEAAPEEAEEAVTDRIQIISFNHVPDPIPDRRHAGRARRPTERVASAKAIHGLRP